MGGADRKPDAQDNPQEGTASDSSQPMIDNVMTLLMARATKPASSDLTDIGQVSRIETPRGWEKGPTYNNRQHAASYQEVHPAGDPNCQLGFYYRGHRTSEAAGHNFHDLLDKPAHALTTTELSALKEIVRDKARPEDFHVSGARTEDINGKRVLVLEGRYIGNQQDSKHMFIDSDGTGTAVQEIFFQASKDKYENYGKAADQAMRSIRWK